MSKTQQKYSGVKVSGDGQKLETTKPNLLLQMRTLSSIEVR